MEFPSLQITRELDRCELDWETLPSKAHNSLLSQWVGTFGSIYEPHWHTKSGGKAIVAAAEHLTDRFSVVPCRDPGRANWRAVGVAYQCAGRSLPDLTAASHFVDLFISPPDCSWTLLYGHEVDVFGGPVFAMADWGDPPPLERQEKLR